MNKNPTEVKGANHSCNEIMPKFQWPNLWRDAKVLLIDLLSLCVIAIAIWCFVRFIVFQFGVVDIVAFQGCDWANLVDGVAWPVTMFVALFLFRNPILRILYELPGLVRRSKYDNSQPSEGAISTDKGKTKFAEDLTCDEGSSHECEKDEATTGNSAPQDPASLTGKSFEELVVRELQEEVWPIIVHREPVIENSGCRFDAAFEKDDYIYCVEIKAGSPSKVLPQMVRRLDAEYWRFTKKTRSRFVFVLCIVSKKDDELKKCAMLMKGNPYCWEIRAYDANGKMTGKKRGSPSFSVES